MIALLVVTDGRDHVHETVRSALANLHGPVTTRVMYDDSGDPAHTRLLRRHFEGMFDVYGGDQRRGFGGAIRFAWDLLSGRDERFVFHLEDDFTFNRPVRLDDLASVLDSYPYLVQMALRRQPWNEQELAAGGIVEQHPDDYAEMGWNGHAWLEHRRFFTTNPSLYRRSLCTRGWPDADRSEGVFTHRLVESVPGARFGFWGARDSGEWVTHVGRDRVGVGY